MELSKNALTVLERRYLMKNGEGVVIETVEELFRRVAGAIAASDRRYDENADCEALADSFYRMMTNLEFLPNSPTPRTRRRWVSCPLVLCFRWRIL